MKQVRFNGVWFENATKQELRRIADAAYAEYKREGRTVIRKRGQKSEGQNWAIRYISGN